MSTVTKEEKVKIVCAFCNGRGIGPLISCQKSQHVMYAAAKAK